MVINKSFKIKSFLTACFAFCAISSTNATTDTSKTKIKADVIDIDAEQVQPNKKAKTMTDQVLKFINDKISEVDKNIDSVVILLIAVLKEFQSFDEIIDVAFVENLWKECSRNTVKSMNTYSYNNISSLDMLVSQGALFNQVMSKDKGSENSPEAMMKDPVCELIAKVASKLYSRSNIPSFVFHSLQKSDQEVSRSHFQDNISGGIIEAKAPSSYFKSITSADVVVYLLHIAHTYNAFEEDFKAKEISPFTKKDFINGIVTMSVMSSQMGKSSAISGSKS